MERLANKVLLLSGGGADGPPKEGEKLAIGNGRATAIQCAREGAAVMVADRSLALARETADAIHAEGGRAEAVAADITDAQACHAAVAATVGTFGALHLLVNNVGIAIGNGVLDTTIEEFEKTLQVNLRGHFLMLQAAVPELIKAGGGAIVNVSSTAAIRGRWWLPYESTKAALLGLTRSAALDLARHNIRVNVILPGLVDSSMLRRLVGTEAASEPRQALIEVIKRVPLQRAGTPWEVAKAILFLLSDDASYITATELVVDGGLTAC